MSVKIRLMRVGKKHSPKYRIIVIDERKKRDGRYIEQVGFYDPLTVPHTVTVDSAKVKSWMEKGAQLSEGARKLLAHK